MFSMRTPRGAIISILSGVGLILFLGQACSDSLGFKINTDLNEKSNGGGYGGMVPVSLQNYSRRDSRQPMPAPLSGGQGPSIQFSNSYYSFGLNRTCTDTSTPVAAAAPFIDEILMIRTNDPYELVIQASSACDRGRVLAGNPLSSVDFNSQVGVILDANLGVNAGRIFLFYSTPPRLFSEIRWPRGYCKYLETKADLSDPDTGIDVLIYSQNNQTFASVMRGSKSAGKFSAASYQPIPVLTEKIQTEQGTNTIYQSDPFFSLTISPSESFETSGRLSIQLEERSFDVNVSCFVPK